MANSSQTSHSPRTSYARGALSRRSSSFRDSYPATDRRRSLHTSPEPHTPRMETSMRLGFEQGKKPTLDERRSTLKSLKSLLLMSQSRMSLKEQRMGREIKETLFTKAFIVGRILLVVVLNFGLLILGILLRQGVVVFLPISILRLSTGMILEITVLILNKLTLDAMDLAASVYFAKRLASKDGYGLLVCGYMQLSAFKRFQFARQLSRDSKYRKTLFIASVTWVIVELVKVRAPITATGFTSVQVRQLDDPIKCIYFRANKRAAIDRHYPNFETMSGNSELLLGNSLGCMRATRDDCGLSSSLVVGPQLLDRVGAGDTVTGPGFQMDIHTTCFCVMDQDLSNRSLSAGPSFFFTNLTTLSNRVLSTVILFDTGYCLESSDIAQCNATIFNIQDVITAIDFSSERGHRSKFPSSAKITLLNPLQTISPESIASALHAIVPSDTIQAFIPLGILKGALTNGKTTKNTTNLATAMETIYAVSIAGGIKRSFAFKGGRCSHVATRNDANVLYLNSRGAVGVLFVATLQLAVSLMSLGLACSWFLERNPLAVVIRIVREPSFFLGVFANSGFSDRLQGSVLIREPSAIWGRLDVDARIGESIWTEDDECGLLTIDSPHLIIPLVNGRMYR
ncbi:hypothetical protein BC830DRAFT_1150060 [Chytriomyces sp. MP71]|nr:hypothetical protein BC830DRAFT_1150060 [Chytriomyces sp. MP71]